MLFLYKIRAKIIKNSIKNNKFPPKGLVIFAIEKALDIIEFFKYRRSLKMYEEYVKSLTIDEQFDTALYKKHTQ